MGMERVCEARCMEGNEGALLIKISHRCLKLFWSDPQRRSCRLLIFQIVCEFTATIQSTD